MASMIAVLVVFHLGLGLARAQQTEGVRRGAEIGVVRQEGVPVAEDVATDVSGSYTDPRRGGALRQVEVTGSEITITGSRKGKSWSATGTINGNKINIDMSSAGESEDMDGTAYASGIQWSDGNSWPKQISGGSGVQTAAKRKSNAAKSISDSNADLENMAQSMSVDQIDESEPETDETNQDDAEMSDSMKPGHLPRIAFIAFLAVGLLVMGTDEGRDMFEALQNRALLAMGKSQALAKAKDPRSMLFKPIVHEAASVMEFGQSEPRRPRESSRKPAPEVSSVIEAAFEPDLPNDPASGAVHADTPGTDTDLLE